MKDAGATALYGSQANGGVIVVTTKKAASDKPRFEIKAVAGLRTADHGNVNMMDKGLQLPSEICDRVIDDRKVTAKRSDI
jgi:TonB-dependent SusC/RagA subfamily outer membrane receptor